MELANILKIVSSVSFVISAISLAIAVFFWFKFNIPEVLGDLSGRTARKSIAQFRENNEKTGKKSYQTSAVNLKRGKVTEAIQGTARKKKESRDTEKSDQFPETGILHMTQSAQAEQTTHTEELHSMDGDQIEETTILQSQETTVLNEGTAELDVEQPRVVLTMIDEVMLIHTDEVI